VVVEALIVSALPAVPFTSLAASVLWSGQRRLDGENYLTGGYGLRLQLERHFTCQPLSALAHVWQPQRLAGVTVASERGIPFYAATQVFDLRPVARKFLARVRTPHLASRYVERGWLLVTCSGSVGDAIIAYRPHEGAVISHDLLRVVPEAPEMQGYLYGFLKSRIGMQMMRSSRYGSIVNHLEPEHLHDVPVPTVPDFFVAECAAATSRVFELRERAYDLTIEAETIFEESVGHVPSAAGELGFECRASDMWGGRRRLDASFHNPRGAEIDAIIRRHKVVSLGEATERVFGVPRFKHIYADHGVPYLDSEDLFKVNPEIVKFIPSVSERARQTYFVRSGWVLMACSGQIYGLNGTSVLAGPWHENKVISNHVNRIVPRESIRSGYLQMALGHPLLGRPLVLRLAFGSEVPEIAAGDLLTVPVVRLEDKAEMAIADRVEEAGQLRLSADTIEDELAASVDALFQERIASEAVAV